MIGVVEQAPCYNSSHERKMKMRKHLLEMLKDLEVILQKANSLKEQWRIAIEEDSLQEKAILCGFDGKECFGL